MKTKILIVFFLALINIQNTVGQITTQFRKGDSIVTGTGCSRSFYIDYLFAPRNIKSYKHIIGDFGKDKFYVYHKGNRLKGLKPNKTKTVYVQSKNSKYKLHRINGLILTDGKTSYYKENQIKDLDIKNIYYLFDNRIPLFKSNNHIYFEGHLLTELNAEKTTIIDSYPNEKINFFTDGNVVYCNDILIENADCETFKRDSYYEIKIDNNKKYKTINIADSHDKNFFYKKGKKVIPYSDWKERKIFADSIYNNEYTVTFISSYQIQKIDAKPAIDFYLKGNDLEKIIKNKILLRKKKMRLNENPYFTELKGYTIEIYNNKNLIDTYYYQEKEEEFDIHNYTKTQVLGDGFHFPISDFNLLRSIGKPINYHRDTLLSLTKWRHKISSLKNSPKVIHIDSMSIFNLPYKGKIYQREVFEYKIENDLQTKMHTYDGLFIFKITRKNAQEILGEDIMKYGYNNRKNIDDLIEQTVGEENYFIDVNSSSIEHFNGIQWISLRVYCASSFMKKVKPEFKATNWLPITHTINWIEF